MSKLGEVLDFSQDLVYTLFTCSNGFTKPHVTWGYFPDTEDGYYQNIFFDELRKLECINFRRNPVQLCYPGQNAGLIGRLRDPVDGMDEAHIRFYEDGAIAAELEHGRFNLGHYREKKLSTTKLLEWLCYVEMGHLPEDVKEGISRQFAIREFPQYLRHNNPDAFDVRQLVGPMVRGGVAMQYTLTATGALWYLSQGDLFSAKEPLLVTVLETLAFLDYMKTN